MENSQLDVLFTFQCIFCNGGGASLDHQMLLLERFKRFLDVNTVYLI